MAPAKESQSPRPRQLPVQTGGHRPPRGIVAQPTDAARMFDRTIKSHMDDSEETIRYRLE